MERQLTADFANAVELPRNPFLRHEQVSDMLNNPDIVGEDVWLIKTRFKDIQVLTEERLIAAPVAPPARLLGRRTLKAVAAALEFNESKIN